MTNGHELLCFSLVVGVRILVAIGKSFLLEYNSLHLAVRVCDTANRDKILSENSDQIFRGFG